jgi:hypothetical protein
MKPWGSAERKDKHDGGRVHFNRKERCAHVRTGVLEHIGYDAGNLCTCCTEKQSG